LNPLWELADFIFSGVPFISKDHQPVVMFIPDNPTNSLGSLPHCVKDQKVTVLHSNVVFQELESALECSR